MVSVVLFAPLYMQKYSVNHLPPEKAFLRTFFASRHVVSLPLSIRSVSLLQCLVSLDCTSIEKNKTIHKPTKNKQTNAKRNGESNILNYLFFKGDTSILLVPQSAPKFPLHLNQFVPSMTPIS